jgi:type IV pilus assembly protein PilW
MNKSTSINTQKQAHGFSLLELLIAIAINLILVVAASYLYLGTSESRKVQADQQLMNENGQFAIELIGRDLLNAGFYPTVWQNNPTPSTAGVQTTTIYRSGFYFNPISTSTITYAAFDTGIFGCEGQNFNSLPSTFTCVNHSSAGISADTLVVNYFSSDALGNNYGSRVDCNRGNASDAPENAGRAGTGRTVSNGLPPNSPLFISNRYTLQPATFNIENRSISTLSLSCVGNKDATISPIVSGIEDFQIRYGIHADFSKLQPSQFYKADQMAGVAALTINGVSFSAWSRVVAVEICVVARGLLGAKLPESDGTSSSYTNCSDALITPTDRDLRKLIRKTFAIRNALTQTVTPAP